MKKFAMSAAVISLATAALVSAAPVASAATEGVTAYCSASRNPYDPEEGSGTAYSYCTADAPVNQHRVMIWCNGSGPYFGNWIVKNKFSTTACSGGERATNVGFQTR